MATSQAIAAGQQFNRWTTIEMTTALVNSADTKTGKSKRRFWLCRCICGNENFVRENDLLSGKSRSCGCAGREVAAKRCYKHGGSETQEQIIRLLWRPGHHDLR